ncbi:lantibiotic dehydratase [Actinomycetes bacterium KLBMP 9759]
MVENAPLRAQPTATLRMSALSAARASPTLADVDPADLDALAAYVREVAGDPSLREAVAVSSASLTHTLDALDAGRPVAAAKLRRAALAITRYALRMSTRSTPFGLMAGVAAARFGDATAVGIGTGHRKGVRADAGWVAGVVRERVRDPEVLRALRVVVNNLCAVRGDRLVLRYAPVLDEAEQAPREVSVRHTPLVAAVCQAARLPVPVTELVARMCEEFPGAAPEAVERLLLQLVERQILLTELDPPPSAPDPVEHLLRHVPGDPELERARAAVAGFAVAPLGEGTAAWRAASGPDGRFAPHVDLALDVSATVHRAVAEEVERAAETLVRLTPSDTVPPHLYRYHLDFLIRYGDSRLVPLVELLDPTTGLDAPAGYRVPRTTREAQTDPRTRRSTERDRLRGALAQQAILDGTGEVVLDDALLDRLAIDDDVAPQAAEFGIEVVADSAAAIDRGDFRVVLWSTLMTLEAGALSGRFAYLLGAPERERLPDAVAAQLEYTPALARSANLSRMPRMVPHTLPVGIFADPADPGVITMDDLYVGGTARRLFLWSERLGAEIVPSMPHMLDPRTQAPNLVRFLVDIAGTRHRGMRPWDWGPAGDPLPYLPRVRRGRSTLWPASWRLDRSLAAPRSSVEEWSERFAAWRDLWRVPRHVLLAVADSRVALDLDAPMHRALLRHEVERRSETFVMECPSGASGTGWLDGHAHELVVTLRSRPAAAVTTAPTALRRRTRHYPGGEWTYAKLYAPEDLHRRLIAHSLDVLRAQLPESVDRWFFIRYADPLPHLRIRLHAPAADVLPLLHDWAGELCEADMAQRLVLDTYEPELARYGGPAVMEAAERAFQADSEAAIAQLRLAPAMPSELLVAANVADIAARFGNPDWREWLLRMVPKDENHAAFRALRADAVALIADGDVDPRLAAIWDARAGAVRAYGDAVRAAGVAPALNSLMHMHQIRLAGISPAAEARAHAIARGAVQVWLDRERHAVS